MTKRKVLVVLGTRPEVIKLANIIRLLDEDEDITARVAITAQHRQMLDLALETFEINPYYDLDIMKDNQDLFDISQRALVGLKDVLNDFEPDYVVVQGDTTTTFMGALAAFYKQIPVGHVEAGLRTNKKYSPFPEEVNRKIVSSFADVHFAPTNKAKNNLELENVPPKDIIVTGNTAIDSLLWVIKNKKPDYNSIFHENVDKVLGKKYILLTTHRRESFGEPMREMLGAIATIADQHPDMNIIFPVHLNPNVRKEVGKFLDDKKNVIQIEPVDYVNFAHLMNGAEIILTDSGGIQEEAPSLGKPLLVLRETTERPEGIEEGVAVLVGTDSQKIISEANKLLSDKKYYESMVKGINPYGDGQASARIVEELKKRMKIN